MESLSRPLHSRTNSSSSILSKKLSSRIRLSSKNAYDDVFAGPPTFRAPTASSRVDDYGEIFGGSGASRPSSIPFLDLSAPDETNVFTDGRRSKIDYSKIFGGYRDDDVAAYDEMFAEPKSDGNFSEESRTLPKAVSPPVRLKSSHDPKEDQEFSYKASNPSINEVKQFTMSYNKSGQLRSNNGTKGTTHIAQLHAVPGFTRVIETNSPLQKTNGSKSAPAVHAGANHTMNFSDEGMYKIDDKMSDLLNKQNAEVVVPNNPSSHDAYSSNEKLHNAYGSVPNIHPSVVLPPNLPAHISNNRGFSKGRTTSNLGVPKRGTSKGGVDDCSPISSDDELDVNSAAAASIAALRKAIETAQESIRIAKESMERNKGFQSFTKSSSRGGLNVKEKREKKVSGEPKRTKEKNAEGIGERMDPVEQVFAGHGRKNVTRSSKVVPEFLDSVKPFIGREVVREAMNTMESAEESASELEISHKRGPSSLSSMKLGITDLRDTDESERRDVERAEQIVENQERDVKRATELILQEEGVERKLKMSRERETEQTFEGENMGKKLEDIMSKEWEADGKRLESAQEVQEQVKNEKIAVAQEDIKIEEKENVFHEQESCEKKTEDSVFHEQERCENKTEDSVTHEQERCGKKTEDSEEPAGNEKRFVCEGRPYEDRGNQQEVLELELNEKILIDGHEDYTDALENNFDHDENDKNLKEAWPHGNSNERQACEVASNEEKEHDGTNGEDNETKFDKVYELEMEIEEMIEVDTDDQKESEKIVEDNYEREETEVRNVKVYVYKETESIQIETDNSEYNVNTEMTQQAVGDEKKFNAAVDACKKDSSKSLIETWEHEGCKMIEGSEDETSLEENEQILGVTTFCSYKEEQREAEQVKAANEPEINETCETAGLAESGTEINENESKMENATKAFLFGGNVADFGSANISAGQKQIGHYESEFELEPDMKSDNFEHKSEKNTCQVREPGISFDEEEDKSNLGRAHEEEQWGIMGKKMEAFRPPDVSSEESNSVDIDEEMSTIHTEKTDENVDKSFAMEENITIETVEKEKEAEIAFDQEDEENNLENTHDERDWVKMARDVGTSQPPTVFKVEAKIMESDERIETSQNTKKNEETSNITFAVEENETKETVSKEMKVEKEYLRKIDEAKAREREREKDRIAVERAIREARERAFAEARERAERAAVERATAEARQRVIAGVREKFEKSSAAPKSAAERAAIEAKLRAERAAVERATAEARERAIERALSQKANSKAREDGEKGGNERFSSASRDNSVGSTNDSQKINISESAQRNKARLERHQRITERAAKALAEKNKRDIMAQREQAERNRIAETLDADVKRWSSGKERNLRALLSTLQYILGPNSGWQPVSLTDIITTDAVKKAYRRATLFVHPDKLQQRGASIQQKYICEKVFDLLKAAWNKFNSEER